MPRLLTADLLDSVVELHVPPELADPLTALLPAADLGTPTAQVLVERWERGYLVTGQGRTSASPDLSGAVEQVLEVCNRTAIEQCRDFAVHAGVVHRDGRVLAIPAASGVGKTTLVASLLRAGWGYVSDEGLVLSRDGDVRPYPKWLSLHRWTLDRLQLAAPADGREERPAPASELGRTVPPQDRLRLTDVVIPTRTSGRSTLTRRDTAVAAVELLRYSFNHYRDPEGSLALVSGVARDCSAWSLTLGDPVEAAALLTTTLIPSAGTAEAGQRARVSQ